MLFRLCVGGLLIEELYPIGFFPPDSAIQTMTSYFGRVVLFAIAGSGSRNMSTTTFAAASMTLKSSVSSSVGGIDHEAAMLRAERFDSCSGRSEDSSLMFGKE